MTAAWNKLQRAWAGIFGHDIFISYSRLDGREAAENLESCLKKAGFLVFLDQSGLQGADHLTASLQRSVRRCRLFVVLLTPGALTSHWVAKELDMRLLPRRHGFGWRRKSRVYPIFCNGVSPAELPFELQRLADMVGHKAMFGVPFPASEGASAIASVFVGWKQQKWLKITLATVAMGIALLGIAIFWQWELARRSEKRAQWENEAGKAESELRFDVAANALALAASTDPRAKDRLWARYQAARELSWLTPQTQFDLRSGERAIWLGEHEGKPLVIIHNSENRYIRLLHESGEIARCSISGDTSPLVAQETTNIFVFAGTTLWKIPLTQNGSDIASLATNLEGDNSTDIMPPVQLAIKNHQLLLLGRKKEQWHVLEVDPLLLTIRNDHALLLPAESDTVVRLAHSENRLALGAALSYGNRAVDIVEWDATGKLHILRSPAAVISATANFPDLDALEIAPDDGQIFVCYNLPTFANPSYVRAAPSQQWLAIDIESPRSAWPMEPRVTHLKPLLTHKRFEAIYETENKAIHALTFPSIVVLDRPPFDLVPNCAAWVVVRNDDNKSGAGVIIAAVSDNRFLILRDGVAVFMTPLPVKTNDLLAIGALTTQSGHFLALRIFPRLDRESESVFVWECGSPPPLAFFPDSVSTKTIPRQFSKATDKIAQ